MYKSETKTLHTKAVKNAMDNYSDNIVLNGRPHHLSTIRKKNSKIIKNHTYSTKIWLGQDIINSYMSRIDESVINKCSACNTSPHDVQHMFNCTPKPTYLRAENLWTQSCEVANFLNL
ncbi:hypothetical protein ACFFRR_009754 [Megaselia abdita]